MCLNLNLGCCICIIIYFSVEIIYVELIHLYEELELPGPLHRGTYLKMQGIEEVVAIDIYT